MYIVVAGCGRLGAGLARVLSSQGNDVVVVSQSIDMKWLGADFDGVTIVGNPIDEETLESAGIRKAEVFVAATGEDVVNAMAAQIAKEVFQVPLALARMTDPAREEFYRELGLSTVCPTSTGINQILDRIQRSSFPALEGYLDPALAGVYPPPEWIGLGPASLPLQGQRRLVGVERRGRLLTAEQVVALQEGDCLILRRAAGKGGRR
jgi:trk system potassium uptake protein TrkA